MTVATFSLFDGKVCTTCKQWKVLTLFNKGKAICKDCQKAYLREYYIRHADELKDKARQWCEAHPEQKKANDRRYREANADKISAYKKVWWERHRGRVLPNRRAWYRQHRDVVRQQQHRKYWSDPDAARAAKRADHYKHREERLIKGRKQYQANKERYLSQVRAWSVANRARAAAIKRNYKARRKHAPGRHTAAEWLAMVQWFGAVCLKCGSTDTIVPDHVISLKRGGTNYISNLQPLCHSCNCSKRDKCIDYRDPERLAAFLATLAR